MRSDRFRPHVAFNGRPGAVATYGDTISRDALPAHETPRRHRILVRRRIRVLRRKSVADRQRAHASCAARLRHHPAVTPDRTGAVAAAVEEYQYLRPAAAGRKQPLARNAIAVDGFEQYIVCYRPNRPHLIETLTTLRPSDRPRL
jgi:hypothetical protein